MTTNRIEQHSYKSFEVFFSFAIQQFTVMYFKIVLTTSVCSWVSGNVETISLVTLVYMAAPYPHLL